MSLHQRVWRPWCSLSFLRRTFHHLLTPAMFTSCCPSPQAMSRLSRKRVSPSNHLSYLPLPLSCPSKPASYLCFDKYQKSPSPSTRYVWARCLFACLIASYLSTTYPLASFLPLLMTYSWRYTYVHNFRLVMSCQRSWEESTSVEQIRSEWKAGLGELNATFFRFERVWTRSAFGFGGLERSHECEGKGWRWAWILLCYWLLPHLIFVVFAFSRVSFPSLVFSFNRTGSIVQLTSLTVHTWEIMLIWSHTTPSLLTVPIPFAFLFCFRCWTSIMLARSWCSSRIHKFHIS